MYSFCAVHVKFNRLFHSLKSSDRKVQSPREPASMTNSTRRAYIPARRAIPHVRSHVATCLNHLGPDTYLIAVYKSTTKFKSGCGWPAFFDGVYPCRSPDRGGSLPLF